MLYVQCAEYDDGAVFGVHDDRACCVRYQLSRNLSPNIGYLFSHCVSYLRTGSSPLTPTPCGVSYDGRRRPAVRSGSSGGKRSSSSVVAPTSMAAMAVITVQTVTKRTTTTRITTTTTATTMVTTTTLAYRRCRRSIRLPSTAHRHRSFLSWRSQTW